MASRAVPSPERPCRSVDLPVPVHPTVSAAALNPSTTCFTEGCRMRLYASAVPRSEPKQSSTSYVSSLCASVAPGRINATCRAATVTSRREPAAFRVGVWDGGGQRRDETR